MRIQRTSGCGLALLAGMTILGLTTPSVAATAAPDASIEPPRVYQEAQILREEVEQIRRILGRLGPRERSYELAGALPRQTYYQSQTLFRKCNQLAQEIAGVSRQRPAVAPDREIVPADVLRMLQSARGQLTYVKEELGITQVVPMPRYERRRTPSDVMWQVIEAGNVINRLVRESADWSQIYDRTMTMITYVGGTLPAETRYPSMPVFECCKMPQDVYASLAQTMERARPIADSVGFELIRIKLKKQAEGGASTDTVFDLTTTMVSDLAEVTLRLEADNSVSPPAYQRPNRIIPAHVLQIAQVLDQQIHSISDSL